MKRISLLLLLCAVSARAIAQTPCAANIACVSWIASAGYTNNTPYPAGTVVQYVVKLVSSTGTVIRDLGSTTSLSYTAKGLPKGSRCFAVVARVQGIDSTLSNVTCKVIRFPAPSDGKIEAPTDGAIEPIF